MKRFPIIQILLILFFVTSGYGAAKKYIQAEIIIDSPEKAIQIQELGLDIVWTRPRSVEIVSDSAELESLKNAGYEIKILLPDMEEFFRSRLAAERKALAVGYKSLGGTDRCHRCFQRQLSSDRNGENFNRNDFRGARYLGDKDFR
jgi:hypothetical protein